MGLQFRKMKKFGPFRLHFTRNGLSSWSFKVGPWSWNSRARAHRLDLPGAFFWRSGSSRSGR